jgi:putative SOS response-associated peptidase YedK
MCGRYTQHHDIQDLFERFNAENGFVLGASAQYNVAPTQSVAVVTEHATPSGTERIVEPMRWGLIPFWAKDPSIGAKMINARSETVMVKPAFRNGLRRKRCLIPADGFYEWQPAISGPKQPFYFTLRDGELFGFAGLYDEWTAPDGSPLRSCTIITTEANEVVRPVHERMPVILLRDDEAAYLNPRVTDAEAIVPLLSPYPAERMTATAVSLRVNRAMTDDPSLIEPLVA